MHLVTSLEVTCACAGCSASLMTFLTRESISESDLTPFFRAIFRSGTSSHAEDEASLSVAEVISSRSSSAESLDLDSGGDGSCESSGFFGSGGDGSSDAALLPTLSVTSSS